MPRWANVEPPAFQAGHLRVQIPSGALERRSALPRRTDLTALASVTEMELAYIAGLFDGEGCVLITYPKAHKNGRRYRRISVKITQKDCMILDWIRDRTGLGHVASKGTGGRYDECFDWTVAYRQCEAFLQHIRPHVRMKAARVDEALGCYDNTAALANLERSSETNGSQLVPAVDGQSARCRVLPTRV